MKKIHYPNLNFIRFFAATIVIAHHIEQIKSIYGYDNFWNFKIVQNLGKLGVDLFFVLSGFLITSLLNEEKKQFKKIYIKDFLIRRVLRIWPIYFLIIVLGLFIVPHINFLNQGMSNEYISPSQYFVGNIALFILFLPHFQTFLIGPILICAQTWSIGIEENFYLFWPFLVNKFSKEKVVKFSLIYIFCNIVVNLLMRYFLKGEYKHNEVFIKINDLIYGGLKFDCLLIGSVFGIYYDVVKNTTSFLTNRKFQFFVYALELILVISGLTFYGLFWEIHALLYGIIIFNIIQPKTSIVNVSSVVFDYLGKISYGMYMYHYLVAIVIIRICNIYGMPYLTYPLTYLSVITLASISYNTFEKYFMRKKMLYSKIITG